MKFLTIDIDSDWTLFLDRDGVINRRLPGRYVRSVDEFEFLPGVLEAMTIFDQMFKHVIVVTNQQGIGKELMTHEELAVVHRHMLDVVHDMGGRIDQIYYCPYLAVYEPLCRKPNPGMAIEAQQEFKDINFNKSIMIGDSDSDITFGNRLGMTTIFVGEHYNKEAHITVTSLRESITYLKIK